MRQIVLSFVLLYAISSVLGNDSDDEYYQVDSRSEETSSSVSTPSSHLPKIVTVKVRKDSVRFCIRK
jgi:hypothetical protein